MSIITFNASAKHFRGGGGGGGAELKYYKSMGGTTKNF